MGFQDEPVAENLYVTYLLGTFFELLLKSDSVHYLFLASNFYFYLLMYQICDTSILPIFDYYDNLVLESFEITPWPRTFTRLTCWELFGTPAEVWLVPLTNCCISLIRILYWTCFSGTIESSCWSPTHTNMRQLFTSSHPDQYWDHALLIMLFFPIDNLMETQDMFTRDEHYDASHLNILMYWKLLLRTFH